MNPVTPQEVGQIAVLAIVLCCIYFGLVICVVARFGNQPPPSPEELCEREDANGCTLLQMAGELEAHAINLSADGRKGEARTLRGWARECRRIAAEHLDTLSALKLESLDQIHDGPIHLGPLDLVTKAARHE